MNSDPDISFHRFFGTLYPADRQKYRGKYDLAKESLTDFELELVQLHRILNSALSQVQKNPHHVEHLPLYFDYIDSDGEGALAFADDTYAFIGITPPLISTMRKICDAIGAVAIVSLAPALRIMVPHESLTRLLFEFALLFVTLHEFTHHVHGHVSRITTRNLIFNEISSSGDAGDMEGQSLELDADGYSVYLLATYIFTDERREEFALALHLESQSRKIQTEIISSCLIMAIGGFFYRGHPDPVGVPGVYTLKHPPQAARMNWVMLQAKRWCSEFHPELSVWFADGNIRSLMGLVATALWGTPGANNWADQTSFFRSADGLAYLDNLQQLWEDHRRSLP